MLHHCIHWCVLLILIVLSITHNPIIVKSQTGDNENISISQLCLKTILQDDTCVGKFFQLRTIWGNNIDFIVDAFRQIKEIKFYDSLYSRYAEIKENNAEQKNKDQGQKLFIIMNVLKPCKEAHLSQSAVLILEQLFIITGEFKEYRFRTNLGLPFNKNFDPAHIKIWEFVTDNHLHQILLLIFHWVAFIDNSEHAAPVMEHLLTIFNWVDLKPEQLDIVVGIMKQLIKFFGEPERAAVFIEKLCYFLKTMSLNSDQVDQFLDMIEELIDHVNESEQNATMISELYGFIMTRVQTKKMENRLKVNQLNRILSLVKFSFENEIDKMDVNLVQQLFRGISQWISTNSLADDNSELLMDIINTFCTIKTPLLIYFLSTCLVYYFTLVFLGHCLLSQHFNMCL